MAHVRSCNRAAIALFHGALAIFFWPGLPGAAGGELVNGKFAA
jgi:hypothetical protein